MFHPQVVKKDFPILSLPHPCGKPLVYLDSAATSQKPFQVIEAISNYYQTSNANVHRGIHYLGDRSTTAWHDSRNTIAKFLGANPEELILLRNATEALNCVAYSCGGGQVKEGDIIVTSQMEHHSNLVPWQELARRTRARIELIPVTSQGTLDLDWLKSLISNFKSQVKIVAISHVSNTLGTINPIEEIVSILRAQNCEAVTVIDGAQAAPHMEGDFHRLGVDFYAVSAHKMLGPMGIGALLAKESRLKEMKPWLFGGGMIGRVEDFTSTFSEDLEDKFTAGTPDVAGAVGWAAACDYLSGLGMRDVFLHDQDLVEYAINRLEEISEITLVGPRSRRCGSVAFVYEGVHAHDVAQILDSEGVATRSGHHCTMPLHTHMNWAATTRISFNVYTSREDIDLLVQALEKVRKVFHG